MCYNNIIGVKFCNCNFLYFKKEVSIMLVKTDYIENIKHAKITLQCELRPACYIYQSGHRVPDLVVVSLELKDLEYGFISPNGEVVMTLSTAMPVGYGGTGANHISPQWLVIELAEAGRRHEDAYDWEEFLASATAKILHLLAIGGDDRIATVEYDDKRFVVMDDTGGHDESDYIY